MQAIKNKITNELLLWKKNCAELIKTGGPAEE
jgi:hypothetical protein